MSGKKQERRDRAAAEEARLGRTLFRRRVALALYCAFLFLCGLGAQVGPWWDTFVGEKQIGETMSGRDFLAQRYEALEGEPDPNDPLAKYRRKRIETPKPLIPANAAALLCVVAFLIASYDLVADADVQLPTFLISLGIAGIAGFVAYRVWQDNSVLDEVLRGQLLEQMKEGNKPNQALPRWVPRWGYALFLSTAPVLLITSTYLTFVADRGGGEKS